MEKYSDWIEFNASSLLIFLIIGNNSEYVISMLEETPIDYNQFDFNKHFINEENKNLILKKSINSQIENSYIDVKKDSIKKSRKIKVLNPLLFLREGV